MSSLRTSSIAVLHNHFSILGGAERVVFEIARVLNAPIYTTYVHPDVNVPEDIEVVELNERKYAQPLFNHAVTSSGALADQFRDWNLLLDLSNVPELKKYDVIVESNHPAKHYTPATGQTIVHYVHTMPQYYYNLYDYVVDRYDLPVLVSLLKLYIKHCRLIDKEANEYVDKFIANSGETRERIETYYARSADIVYPPVTGEWRCEADEGYFITWSRLAPRKRVDLIAEAFTHLDEQLVIVGDGPERANIEQIAHGYDNIKLLGYVEDVESLVARATAVVYAPVDEPFGMVGAEALCAGKPLLGVDEGFTRRQITPKTGRTFRPTVESIAKTVREFEPSRYDPDEIQEIGKRYSHENFESTLTRSLRSVCQTSDDRIQRDR